MHTKIQCIFQLHQSTGATENQNAILYKLDIKIKKQDLCQAKNLPARVLSPR